jgi:hypothetical protein
MSPATSLTTLAFCLSSAHFFTALCIRFGLPHFIVLHFSWCQFNHTIDNLDTHLFWCPCRRNVHRPTTNFKILLQLLHNKREVSHIFPHHIRRWMNILITRDDIHILMDIIIVDLHIYSATNINDNCYLGENTILHPISIKRWLHSPYYWNIQVSSFSFWFILDRLCADHYHTSSKVFFNPLDVHFSLSTTCVYNPTMCTNHSDSSTNYCIWSKFFIFFRHHS